MQGRPGCRSAKRLSRFSVEAALSCAPRASSHETPVRRGRPEAEGDGSATAPCKQSSTESPMSHCRVQITVNRNLCNDSQARSCYPLILGSMTITVLREVRCAVSQQKARTYCRASAVARTFVIAAASLKIVSGRSHSHPMFCGGEAERTLIHSCHTHQYPPRMAGLPCASQPQASDLSSIWQPDS